MAVASRFVLLNDEKVKEFSESFDNENTKKKTLYDLKLFKEFLDTCDEKREIEDIAPVELQEIIKKFVLAVRKKNGEEYEPSSIRAFIQSINLVPRVFSLFNMAAAREKTLAHSDLNRSPIGAILT